MFPVRRSDISVQLNSRAICLAYGDRQGGRYHGRGVGGCFAPPVCSADHPGLEAELRCPCSKFYKDQSARIEAILYSSNAPKVSRL